MGLIKALTNSVSTTFGDQFKEYVTCPSTDKNVVIVRGEVSHGKGNSNPSPGVISNGSKIVVPQGWAMMLVDNGKVVGQGTHQELLLNCPIYKEIALSQLSMEEINNELQ